MPFWHRVRRQAQSERTQVVIIRAGPAGLVLRQLLRKYSIDNLFVKRLWRSVKYECVYLNAFESGRQLRAGINGEGDRGTVSVVRNAQPRHDVIACGAT